MGIYLRENEINLVLISKTRLQVRILRRFPQNGAGEAKFFFKDQMNIKIFVF